MIRIRLLRYILCVVSFVFLSEQVSAATARFNKIWLEHDVIDQDRKCMAIHFDVNVIGMKGKEVSMIAYVDIPKGQGHKDTNGQYRTSGGNVCALKKVKCSYDNSHRKDCVIMLPNDEIHPKPGRHEYFVRVWCFDNGNAIGHSDFVSFTMSGKKSSGDSSGNYGKKAKPSKRKNGNKKNGEVTVECPVCHGSKTETCFACMGLGRDRFGACFTCGGSGRQSCKWCGGRGRVTKKRPPSPGPVQPGPVQSDPNCDEDPLCPTCHGSTVCKYCGGSRGFYKDVGYYVGEEILKWFPCSSCGGSGECSTCYGRGRIR